MSECPIKKKKEDKAERKPKFNNFKSYGMIATQMVMLKKKKNLLK